MVNVGRINPEGRTVVVGTVAGGVAGEVIVGAVGVVVRVGRVKTLRIVEPGLI